MQRIRYSAPRPWPDTFSLVEAVEVKNNELSPTKVIEHIGRVGIIPHIWNKEKQDWYVDILEFMCIRTVQRQNEKVMGPFKYISGIEDFVLLEDFKRIQFWFPKFLRQDKENETFFNSTAIWIWTFGCYETFSSTAIWIWTFGCYCKALEGQNDVYPPVKNNAFVVMACRLKSMKELAREVMKRNYQEHQEMEKMRQQ
ncbi:hypothetical protein R1flu_027559 [Riccia fluitans]|uniref:Uncharacterized protein n=1 Tax=Riccia fluitans TaxID=41844 RepID=A0ABD1XM10_9MARC